MIASAQAQFASAAKAEGAHMIQHAKRGLGLLGNDGWSRQYGLADRHDSQSLPQATRRSISEHSSARPFLEQQARQAFRQISVQRSDHDRWPCRWTPAAIGRPSPSWPHSPEIGMGMPGTTGIAATPSSPTRPLGQRPAAQTSRATSHGLPLTCSPVTPWAISIWSGAHLAMAGICTLTARPRRLGTVANSGESHVAARSAPCRCQDPPRGPLERGPGQCGHHPRALAC
jgi:hypothetical protein